MPSNKSAERERLSFMLHRWATPIPWRFLLQTIQDFEAAEKSADEAARLFPDMKEHIRLARDWTETIRLDLVRQKDEFTELHNLAAQHCPAAFGKLPSEASGDPLALARQVKEALAVFLEAAQKEQAAAEQAPVARASHSADFRSLHWFGADFIFTEAQARIVAELWKAWLNKTPVVGYRTLLSAAKSESSRVQDVFKSKGKSHPAWGTMIVPVPESKGACRLQQPD